MNAKTQNAAILQHLKKGLTITPLRALELYGCFRLSARIFDLRGQGHLIEKKTVTMRSNGRAKSVAQYYMPSS